MSGKPNYDYVGKRYAIDTAIANGKDSPEELAEIDRRFGGGSSEENKGYSISTADDYQVSVPQAMQQSVSNQHVEVSVPQRKRSLTSRILLLSLAIIGFIIVVLIITTYS